MSRSGSCACGKISVDIPESVSEQTICHCNGCSKASGGLGSFNLMIPSERVKVTGQPKTYVDKDTTSGTPLKRQFCGDCGNPMLSYSGDMSFVKSTLFKDNQKVFKPVVQIFCSRAEKWSVLPEISAKDVM